MRLPSIDMRALATGIAAAVLLAACGGGGGESGSGTATASGTLRLALTDAPAWGYDQVNVTIDRIRVHSLDVHLERITFFTAE